MSETALHCTSYNIYLAIQLVQVCLYSGTYTDTCWDMKIVLDYEMSDYTIHYINYDNWVKNQCPIRGIPDYTGSAVFNILYR